MTAPRRHWLAAPRFAPLLGVAIGAVAGAVYWAQGDIEIDRRPLRLSRAAIVHASALENAHMHSPSWPPSMT